MKKTNVLAGSLAAAAVAIFATPGFAAADPVPAPAPKPLDGKTVFLDPASSLASAADQAKMVADGRGGSVPCVNPTAIAANGTPDHKVNFAVAKMVEAALQSQGAKVLLSRANDAGFGGCIDQRAQAANASGADLAVSINSAIADAAQRGFSLETAAPGVADPSVQAQQVVSAPAATVLRDAQVAGGLIPAQYLGASNGIAQTLSALPSLVKIPLVQANLGNFANPEDSALLTSNDGQVRYAAALANGIMAQLTGKVVPGGAVAEPVQAPVQVDPGTVPQPPVGTAAAVAPVAAPAAVAPVAPVAAAQVPIVPVVPGVPSAPAATAVAPVVTAAAPVVPGASPIVAGVPLLQGGAPAGTVQAPAAVVPGVAAPAAAPAQTVMIPGLGSVNLPQLPQITLPGQSAPIGVNTIFDMGPKAVEFLSSAQGQQLVSALLSSPQAINSLQSAQGPAAAQEILKAILSAGAILPR